MHVCISVYIYFSIHAVSYYMLRSDLNWKAMNALLRNTTLRFNPRSPLYDGYKPVDYHRSDSKEKTKKQNSSTRRTFSRRKRCLAPCSPIVPVFDRSRSERVRQRQIFLKTYKLASSDSLKKSRRQKTVKRVLVKLRRAVVRIVSFTRFQELRSCIVRCVPRPKCGLCL